MRYEIPAQGRGNQLENEQQRTKSTINEKKDEHIHIESLTPFARKIQVNTVRKRPTHSIEYVYIVRYLLPSRSLSHTPATGSDRNILIQSHT